MIVRFKSSSVAVALLILASCAKNQPVAKVPVPAQPFSVTIALAEKRVDAGDYAGADRILADFALKAKGTDEATESSFWRALYLIDPLNRGASIPDGLRALDIYLQTPGARWYRPQAQVLKRTAQTVQVLRLAQIAPRPVGKDTVFINREDEIAALKDQLAKANAELERIKKRLANPSR